MKFGWTTLKVKNLEESLKFYTEIIELKIVDRFSAGPMIFAFLGEGETKIELIEDPNQREISVGEDISWGFEVASLAETMDMLSRRGIAIVGPIQPNPTIRFIFIKDPNGMKIQLTEHVAKH